MRQVLEPKKKVFEIRYKNLKEDPNYKILETLLEYKNKK